MGTEKDCLFEDAARLIVSKQRCRTLTVQLAYSIGYNRTGRIMMQLEAAGIVGPSDGITCREVLVKNEADLEMILSKYRSNE